MITRTKEIKPMATNETFTRLRIKGNVKREIDIIAASENRDVYVVVEDMLKLYKAVSVGKLPRPKGVKVVPVVTVAEVVATHDPIVT